MKDRIGAIIIGKINGDIGTWINDIRDDRWSDLDYIEDRFDIVHFETDENIEHKLNFFSNYRKSNEFYIVLF